MLIIGASDSHLASPRFLGCVPCQPSCRLTAIMSFGSIDQTQALAARVVLLHGMRQRTGTGSGQRNSTSDGRAMVVKSAGRGGPPPFPADLPAVGQVIYPNPVTGRATVPAGRRRTVGGDLTVHLRPGWQRRAALQQVRDPPRLDLVERHDRADWLHKPDEVQPRQRRRDDAVIQRDEVVLGAAEAAAEEWKSDVVPGAVDHDVSLLGAAVGEVRAVAVEPLDTGPDRDDTVPQLAEKAVGDRGRAAQQLMIGPRQAVSRQASPGG